MPYIGRGLGPQGAFRILDDLSLSSHTSGGFNGSRTTFALTVGTASLTVGLPETLIIAVDGVIQEPGSAYTISGSNIVFTAAPQADATFWGVELGDVGGIAKSIADGTITTDSLASGVLDTNISSVSGSDDTLASAKSIKTYVDAQVTAQDLDATTDSGTIDIDLDSETLTIAGGEGIDTSASGTTITIAGEEASTSNKGVASFHSDNFAVSSGVVTIKNAGVAIAEIATTSGTAGSDTFLRGDGQWQAAGGGTSVAGTTDNAILTFVNSGSTFAAEADLTFDGSTLLFSGSAENTIKVTTSTGTAPANIQIAGAAGGTGNGGANLIIGEGALDGTTGDKAYRFSYLSNVDYFRFGSVESGDVFKVLDGTKELLVGENASFPSVTKGILKAWVRSTPTGTRTGSYNVWSVVDNGTGDWLVQWDVDFEAGTYALSGICLDGANQIVLRIADASYVDKMYVHAVVGGTKTDTHFCVMAAGEAT